MASKGRNFAAVFLAVLSVQVVFRGRPEGRQRFAPPPPVRGTFVVRYSAKEYDGMVIPWGRRSAGTAALCLHRL
ncbi:hypothetical protein [Aminivibrio sp.]|uniref:hypothetical protein n=1 Tax=Aminivibrio sp. TaxID=1872489 RepID=UPI001A5ECCAB|nr:hypothetical protein [Aminivibrio sp.]MBL3539951.1 hypothetical protein [Aminivibrio sp.]